MEKKKIQEYEMLHLKPKEIFPKDYKEKSKERESLLA